LLKKFAFFSGERPNYIKEILKNDVRLTLPLAPQLSSLFVSRSSLENNKDFKPSLQIALMVRKE